MKYTDVIEERSVISLKDRDGGVHLLQFLYKLLLYSLFFYRGSPVPGSEKVHGRDTVRVYHLSVQLVSGPPPGEVAELSIQ